MPKLTPSKRVHFARLFIGLALLPSAASAATIYLECNAVNQTGHQRHLRISLNEAQGTAQITVVETGYAATRSAMFTPNEVTWVNPVAGFRQHLAVNRTSLKFSSYMDGIGDAGESGQCVIPTDDPNRKF
jgi:hypothetical protein